MSSRSSLMFLSVNGTARSYGSFRNALSSSAAEPSLFVQLPSSPRRMTSMYRRLARSRRRQLKDLFTEGGDQWAQQREIVLAEPAAVGVDLRQPPGAVPCAERRHQQRIELELAQQVRLRPIAGLVEQRAQCWLAGLEHVLRQWEIGDQIAVAEDERPAVERVFGDLDQDVADDA